MTAVTLHTIERSGSAPAEPSAREMSRHGLAFSAALHVGVLLAVVVGLPNLFRHTPAVETPIAVQLVTIAPETRATHPNPYRPMPDAKPEPPIAAPAPKPEPKPEPPPPASEPPAAAAPPPTPAPPQPPKPEVKAPPPPPPPPKPVEAQAPPVPPPPRPEPKPQQMHHQVHHVPPETKKADPAAFEKLLNNLEEKKPEPASFDSLLKNLTKQQTAQVEDQPRPRPRVMASAPPSSQPKAPLGSQLTASETDALVSLIRQRLYPCWNVPAYARDAKDLNVEIRASLNPDGTVIRATIVDQGRMGDALYRAAAESARRTFGDPRCTPLKLPADKYEVWKDLDLIFDPKDLL